MTQFVLEFLQVFTSARSMYHNVFAHLILFHTIYSPQQSGLFIISIHLMLYTSPKSTHQYGRYSNLVLEKVAWFPSIA